MCRCIYTREPWERLCCLPGQSWNLTPSHRNPSTMEPKPDPSKLLSRFFLLELEGKISLYSLVLIKKSIISELLEDKVPSTHKGTLVQIEKCTSLKSFYWFLLEKTLECHLLEICRNERTNVRCLWYDHNPGMEHNFTLHPIHESPSDTHIPNTWGSVTLSYQYPKRSSYKD